MTEPSPVRTRLSKPRIDPAPDRRIRVAPAPSGPGTHAEPAAPRRARDLVRPMSRR
ncbi:MAG: hypothetical protein WBA25_08760 [Jannaschia sp.]